MRVGRIFIRELSEQNDSAAIIRTNNDDGRSRRHRRAARDPAPRRLMQVQGYLFRPAQPTAEIPSMRRQLRRSRAA